MQADFTQPILDPTATPALSKEDLAQYVLRGAAQLSATKYPDQLREIGANYFLPAGLQYAAQVENPQRITTVDPMTPGWEQVMRKNAAARLTSFTTGFDRFNGLVGAVQGMALQDPESAVHAGVTEEYWRNLVEQGKALGEQGIGALNFMLRNLDRGRGAIMEYANNINHGAHPDDARRRALDVLKGSEHGWVLAPEKMGPSGAELLRGLGYDEGWGTKLAGFALDVAVDPINLLGIGASRKGLQIGAHQILNDEGRQLWLKTAQRIANEHGFETVAHAPFEVQQAIEGGAHAELRKIINSSDEAAKAYLDMGGLKIAGMTLVHAPLRVARYERRGNVMISRESQSLARAFGSKTLDAVDKIGSWSTSQALPLPERLRTVMQLLPSSVRNAAESVGMIMNRTNPFAGEDWKIFKQANYIDLMGYKRNNSMNAVAKIFGQFDIAERKAMTWAIEDGTVDQLPAAMQNAVKQWHSLADGVLREEVMRGIMKPEWNPTTRQNFLSWMDGVYSPQTPAEEAMFLNTRIPRYVPHIYRDVRMARTLSTRMVGPRAPHIVEGFTERRLFATLREAEAKGLVPETDIFALAAHRLTTADQAIVTFDFLKQAAEEFGELSPKYVKQMMETATTAGANAEPFLSWQRYDGEQTTHSGLLVGDKVRHMNIAREISRQSHVPAELVAKLDDDAKREFLLHRFRTVNPQKAHQIWAKYVERPTQLGIYNGHAVAPGADAIASAAAARELSDPVYGSWSYLSTGGKGDPAILNRLLLPDPIVKDIERLKMRVLPPEMQTLLRAFDAPNFWWKASVTLPFPAFHFRNKLTNILNSSLEAGLGVITDRPTMAKIMWGHDGILRTETGRTYTYAQVRELAARHGVFLTDYHRADIGDSIEEMARLRIGKNKNIDRIPLKGGEKRAGIQSLANPTKGLDSAAAFMREGSAALENSDRLLVFVSSLKRGLSAEQAAQRVSRVMFDWQDLSAVEKGWFRRIIPFYTWARKNLALQAEVAVTQPARLAAYEKLRHNFSSESKQDNTLRSYVERELLPRALHDEMGIRLEDGPRTSTWLMNFDAPVGDLDKFWSGTTKSTTQAWFSQLHPLIKGIIEAGTGTNLFTGKQNVEFGANDKVYDLMLRAPEPIKKWLELREVVNGDDTSVRVNGAKYRKLMWVATMSGMSRVWSTVGNVTNTNVSLSHRLFQLFTGGKIQKVDPYDAISRDAKRRMTDINKQLQDAQRNMLGFMMLKKGQTAIDSVSNPMAGPVDPEDIADEMAILTPTEGNEMEERDGITIP